MIYLAIVFLPIVGALIAGLFGRFIGARASEFITTGLLIIATVLSWVAFVRVGFDAETARVPVMRWITSGELDIAWSLRIDTLTAVMLVVVTTVSALVHVYSIGYMHEDPSRSRFFAYLSLFTFAMLMLVTSDNLLQMFFGWEGVGLASYLLIGFWYTKPEANAAAIKAFVVNRVGDFGFMLGMFGLFFVFNTLNFDPLFEATAQAAGKSFNFLGYEVDILTTLCLLLFMGAMGKSAQFLLHTWLPDAMEGPTPVSALIHAATMVTAGVFMVARLSPIFEYAPTALEVVTLVGTVTAFFAATVGLVQNDIKRVIAYSTCSQLGYMFAALGVGAYSVGIFHLFTHAFFKALLFLGAGSVIHAMHHEQDMRNMGGLAGKIPITWAMMLIGTLALTGVGIPHVAGFAGFHSKDAIIEATFAAHTPGNFVFWVLVFTAFLTAFYSWRLVFMTFHGKTRAAPDVFKHAHESPWVMLVPLFVLAFGAVVAGFVFAPYFIGESYAEFWGKALFTAPSNHILHDMHHVEEWVYWAPFLAMASGFALSWIFYVQAPWLPEATARTFRPIYLFLLNKWYFDELYNWLFVRSAKGLGRFLWKAGDGAVIDGTINGTADSVQWTTGRVVKLQSGYIYHYAFAMLIGVALILTYFLRSLVMTGGAGQ
ncbi:MULTISPECIES: NADH-quinone oxidoreductase subunit L [Filomicrobium]|uniref:NADH-quinone oxidoreductase subunit L n=1 Tax=Filomicrobium insigne TaxID=418854 RepID=A0A1H0R3C1_9HYPH|nr:MULTISPECIES: NADH-quinone oxidoreductase subunit L [Filomicrobium]MCV0369413.1 NADH-quinone oxidoreductase subunit L [Filomicrobium sp.]SDP23895.1 NADH-quinone oxidoreductase subunit L [Filomicrobium insigne]